MTKGTGLGLSQVYGFVRQSGGNVKIYSELNVGTTIKIYLPRSCGDAEEDLSPNEQSPVANAVGETIMVVEDEERSARSPWRRFGIFAIRLWNFEDRGKRSTLSAEDKNFSLLLTDVVMPEMSGRELVERAKQLRPDIKVLYTTGYTRDAIVHNGTLDVGTELLTKPYTIEELAEKVDSVLDL